MDVPSQIGDFRIERTIGSGPLGTVYVAEQISLGRMVALKVLSKSRASSSQQSKRFFHNARVAANIFHNNIARIFSTGNENGLYYVAREFISGANANELIASKYRLSIEESAQIVRCIANGLSAAIDSGVAHMNLKPSNILLSEDHQVRIVDFGVNTTSGSQEKIFEDNIETASFRAPEQIPDPTKGDIVSDIYSLGLIWFFLLTGNYPFKGAAVEEILLKQRTMTVPALALKQGNITPKISFAVESMIRKMTDKNPAARYQSPGELVREFDTIGLGTGGPCAVEILSDIAEEVATRLGKSTTVKREKPVPVEEQEDIVWDKPERTSPLFLVADDIASARLLYKTVLEGMGYKVVVASNGIEAKKIIEQKIPDVAILDIGMPGMSGLELLERMTARKCPTKFIVVTGHKDRDTVLAASRHKLFAYITKPINIKELRQRIEETIKASKPVHHRSQDDDKPKRKPVHKAKSELLSEQDSSFSSDNVALVVDENEYTMILIKTLLIEKHYRVVSASDGLEALKISHVGKPNMIVIGTKAGQLSPIELLRRIREEQKMDTPVMVNADSKAVSKYRNVACYDVPIKNEDFLAKFSALMSGMPRITRNHESATFVQVLFKQQRAHEKHFTNLVDLAVRLSEMNELDQITFREKIKFYSERQLKQIIMRLLQRQPKDKFFGYILMAYQNGNYLIRSFCIELLAHSLEPKKLDSVLANMLGDTDYRIRTQIIAILAKLDVPDSVGRLVVFLNDSLYRVRAEAIAAIKSKEPQSILVPVVKYCVENNAQFPQELNSVVDSFKQPAQLAVLEKILETESVPVRKYIIELLGNSASILFLKTLISLLTSPEAEIRIAAVSAIARLPKNEKTLAVFISAIKDSDPRVKDVANNAIKSFQLSGVARDLVNMIVRDNMMIPHNFADMVRTLNNGEVFEIKTLFENVNDMDSVSRELILALLHKKLKGKPEAGNIERLLAANSSNRIRAADEIASAIFRNDSL